MIRAAAAAALLAAAGCQGAAPPDTGFAVDVFRPDYLGVETRLLEGDLVAFDVAMGGARGPEDVTDYAECAAAQYALIRGFGWARHVRTRLSDEAGVSRADAVYSVTPDRPAGLRTIDAAARVDECRRAGVATV